MGRASLVLTALAAFCCAPDASSVDFSREIRPILSQNCFMCHGPDENERKGGSKETGGLRLDTLEGQRQDLGGYAAVVPGRPDESELLKRIITTDEHDLMPPPSSGKQVTPEQAELIRQWIAEGARFSDHWAYEKPVRPKLPDVRNPAWIRNGIDAFILAGLEAEGLTPQPEASRNILARRVALDLTGLPPTPEELDQFVNDPSPDAYERYLDRLFSKTAYGEHWARMWLDLARYADSAGYADDPPRSIWAYRDYVIRAFNENMPFDQFTIEQIAGDLLPDPTEDQLKATAFHRNTMTNSEGGTSDEEFRNVAIVDRVNTTFAVWMGTSMACAQCHSHKYDPISQKEYFELFAFFNNTADADRPDEAPYLEFYTDELKQRRAAIDAEFTELDRMFRSAAPDLAEAAVNWARVFPAKLDWQAPRPSAFKTESGASIELLDDNSLLVASAGEGASKDTYTVEIPFDTATRVTGLRLEALTDDSLEKGGPGHGGNFVVRQIKASLLPVPNQAGPNARFVRLELPGASAIPLAEVQVFSSGENVAPKGIARRGTTRDDAAAAQAIDGRTEDASETQASSKDAAWWELDLKSSPPIERIVVWGNSSDAEKLKGFRIVALDDRRVKVWETTADKAPAPSIAFELTGPREVEFATAAADVNQDGLNEALVVTDKPRKSPRRKLRGERGWAVGDATGHDHTLTAVLKEPLDVPQGATLRISIAQQSGTAKQTLGRFRVAVTTDARVDEYAETPPAVLATLAVPEHARDDAQRNLIVDYFVRNLAPGLASERERYAELERQRESIKPFTVPVFRELEGEQRRTTKIQLRGDFQLTTDEVHEGVPAAWHPFPEDAPRNRLGLAKWLMSDENPLTARVIANRYWEQIFGTGIVRTSEEFGAQGELPVNQPLLDWLACELMDQDWNIKGFLRLLVTSAAYRQSSRVTPEALEKDPDNRLISRGPRFRMTAEMIRDQALAVAGLLSPKLYGPSVRPMRPNLDLRAAFGGNLDWQPSKGEDRYRRGLYTEWRRTSPYPSMVTFDAPSREVCTLRRTRSNTPLQALVTLNDPVYIEAAQGLARHMVAASNDPAERLRVGMRRVLARTPSEPELEELLRLYSDARTAFAEDPEKAARFATDPLGDPPPGCDLAELASWTAVANVLLNLDETLMKL